MTMLKLTKKTTRHKNPSSSLVVGGIDYGQDGCLCLYVKANAPVFNTDIPDKARSLQFYDLPWNLDDKDNKTDRWDSRGWSDLLDEVLPQCPNTLIVVERFFARFATTGHISSAIHWGMMVGELRRREIPHLIIGGPEWKRKVGATKDKERSVSLARRRWHGLLPERLRHDEAEASLLAAVALELLLDGSSGVS